MLHKFFKWLSCLIIFSFLMTSVFAVPQIINSNNPKVSIMSDDTYYYCKPIFNQDGACLIEGEVTIINDENNKDLFFSNVFSFSSAVDLLNNNFLKKVNKTVVKVKKKNNFVNIPKKDLGLLYESINNYTLSPGESLIIPFSFYAYDDGKFNVSLIVDKRLVVLDPFYNVTFNPVLPTNILINGSVNFDNDSSFDFSNDVTNVLSDNNLSSGVVTFPAQVVSSYNLIDGFSFNSLVNNNPVISSFSGVNFAYRVGNVSTVLNDKGFYSAVFNGDGYLSVPTNPLLSSIDVPTSFCIEFNTSRVDSGYNQLFSFYYYPAGVFLHTIDGELYADVYGTNRNSFLYGGFVADGNKHYACLTVDAGSQQLIVDGVIIDSNSVSVQSIKNNGDLFIGSSGSFNDAFIGSIELFGIFNGLVSPSDSFDLVNYSLGSAVSVYFNHSFSLNDSYFLVLDVNVSDNPAFRFMPYSSSGVPDSNNFIDANVVNGENIININSLISEGYNNTFRIFSLEGSGNNFISEIYLLKLVNDSSSPVINDCWFDKSSLSCNDFVNLYCSVSDDFGVESVSSIINFGGVSSFYNLLKINDSLFSVSLPAVQSNSSFNVYLVSVSANDFLGNVNSSLFSNVYYTNDCVSCVPDWVRNDVLISCDFNDSGVFQINYFDNNICNSFLGLPPDNGTFFNASCDYCVPDWVKQNNSCSTNNTRLVSYVDANNCFLLTGLSSDNVPPVDNGSFEYCSYYADDFSCNIPEELFFNDRFSFSCVVPLINGSDYDCVVNVLYPDGDLVRSYPERSVLSDGFVSKDYDDRSVFSSSNGLLNAYLKNDDLLPNKDYVSQVVCSDGVNVLFSENAFVMKIKRPDVITEYTLWAGDNADIIIFSLLLLLIISFSVVIIVRVVKK